MKTYELHTQRGYWCSLFPSDLVDENSPTDILDAEARKMGTSMKLIEVDRGVRRVIAETDGRSNIQWDDIDFDFEDDEDDE
jgi:hypothetical protein